MAKKSGKRYLLLFIIVLLIIAGIGFVGTLDLIKAGNEQVVEIPATALLPTQQ